MRGFKNFLMQGDLIVIAVGLSIALAFSTLIGSFTNAVITPLVNAAGGSGAEGLGFHVNGQFVDFGAVISATKPKTAIEVEGGSPKRGRAAGSVAEASTRD